jgi:predicted DNA-binding protein (UPF0278 family)
MKGTEESKIARLEGTIRRRDKLIEKLQKELEAKEKHLSRVKNDLLPPVYKEIRNVTAQRDSAKADVSVIQAWICAIMQTDGVAQVQLPDELISEMLKGFRLRAEKLPGFVALEVEKIPEEELQ